MPVWTIGSVKNLHIELSSLCNAKCPACPRYVNNSPIVKPSITETQIRLDQFKQWFPPELLKSIESITFCGNFGDPMTATDIVEILEYCEENKIVKIDLHSNTGLRSEEVWSNIGQIFARNADWTVEFSVDGLADTNHIYRRGVVWKNVERNIKAYTQHGGYSIWEFLVFRHNEHQVDEVKAVAKSLGVRKVRIKKALNLDNGQRLVTMPAIDKHGNLEYVIEPPSIKQYRNLENPLSKKVIQLDFTFDPTEPKGIDIPPVNTPSLDTLQHWDQVSVICRANESCYVSANGLVAPCCWVGITYPMFGDTFNTNWDAVQLKNTIEAYGFDKFNLHNSSLLEIINSGYLDDVFAASWQKSSVLFGKLAICANTCGSENSLDRLYKNEPTNKANSRLN